MTQLKEKVRPAGRGKLSVEYVAIDSIRPSKHNTRTHPPEQITQILRSIKEFGWTKPIIVDEKGEILAGHGAYQAAQQDGMVEVPIIRRAGLTAAQKRAYRTADNKIGEDSDWDRALLGAEFEALMNMGYDVTLTGFSQTEVDFILKPPAQATQEPPAPPPGGPAISKQGDLWLLGNHRLLCGDSTKPATFKQLMNGQTAQCVFTDPPYGVSYQARADIGSRQFAVLQNDDKRRGGLKDMLVGAFSGAMKHTKDDAAWYVWHADNTRVDFHEAMVSVGLIERSCIIWVKGLLLGANDYQSAHEPCFYASKQGCRPAFHGDRTHSTTWRIQSAEPGDSANVIGQGIILVGKDGNELFISETPPRLKKLRHIHAEDSPVIIQGGSETATVWEVSRDTGAGERASIHPTQKPVELSRRALKNSTLEGQIVLDMFSGSGSTIMGAEQTRRVGYAVELDPLYVDASIRRWQTMTGKAATHAEEKTTFDAIASARAAKTA